jgi:hypothetical protein
MKLSNRNWRNAAMSSILLIELSLAGCSQHEGLPTAEDNATADQHLPFEGTSDKGGIFPTGSLTPTAIPAGTPLAVHLQSSLSSATSRSGDSFEALLDEAIVVRGQTVVPRGTTATGKVLEARASGQLQDPGYMRLALTAISLNGKSYPIQTSSIFVKRGSHEKRNLPVISGASMSKASTGVLAAKGKETLIGASTGAATGPGMGYASENEDVGVAPERRLTFRLAQPLPLRI